MTGEIIVVDNSINTRFGQTLATNDRRLRGAARRAGASLFA